MQTKLAKERAYLGLGSNDGDRERNLFSALEKLSKLVEIEKISPLYRTAHIGPPAPDYYNCVCQIVSTLSSSELLEYSHSIESALGRDRSAETRWGPRTIDIDILLVNRLVIETRELTVPHPRMMQRKFVLAPLASIAPDLVIPSFDVTAVEALTWNGVIEQSAEMIEWNLPIASLISSVRNEGTTSNGSKKH